MALHLAGGCRRLEPAHQRVVAALGVEVVADHEDLPSAEAELADQRLAGVVPGRVRRVDQARATGSAAPCRAPSVTPIRAGRAAAGPVDEGQAAVGAEQERDPDVAARLAAVGVVDRVDLAVLSTCGPPAAWIAATSLSRVTFAATTPSSVAPSLSWISSSDTMSGERRLCDEAAGEPVELVLRVGRARGSPRCTSRSRARSGRGFVVDLGLDRLGVTRRRWPADAGSSCRSRSRGRRRSRRGNVAPTLTCGQRRQGRVHDQALGVGVGVGE